MIINWCLHQWYKGKCPAINLLPTDDDEPNATLHQLFNEAYHNQCTIGWGHFLRGRIAKTRRRAIAHYYYERRPGSHFSPALWAQKTINQVWTTFRTIWLCRNGELYGKDYEEQCATALRTTRASVQRIYEQSKDQVSEEDSNTLHLQPIEEVMKWTKCHLDAYLQQPKCIWSRMSTPVKYSASLHHNSCGCGRREVYDSTIVQLNQHL
jgi:hypothetical protein